ncbi:TVP38/TMEM64 family protein [Desulfocurvibacter africanus]|uniref:TVP38/TMEM64 family protein n=1 Tax=Desulfocurvibacter africanus TaxID=873 RepID=UPI002FD9A70B
MTKSTLKKLLIIAAVALILALFFALDLGQYFSLDYLKQSRARFAALYEQHTLLVLGAYFGIYVVSTALSLPGATVLTLGAGALFGFWTGLVLASFASTLGATLACFLARYLLRGWVQKRFEDRLQRVNEGVRREGAFYLFTMRLVPIFPFFLINVAMGLTPMRIWTFAWVSQLGMLPGTAVYVNAGRQLAGIESMGDIFSPGLILSFALLGIFPLATKKAINIYRRKSGRQPVRDTASK